MASWQAVVYGLILHTAIGVGIIVRQDFRKCSTAPQFGSWIFLVATLLFLLSVELYPVRFMHLPLWCQLIVETVLSLVILEVMMAHVWCSLERLMHHIVRLAILMCGVSEYNYLKMEYMVLGVVTCAVALLALSIIVMATKQPKILYNHLKNQFRPNVEIQLNLPYFYNYTKRQQKIVKPNKRSGRQMKAATS